MEQGEGGGCARPTRPSLSALFRRHEKLALSFKAILAATFYCLVGGLIFTHGMGLTTVDSVYFMCVTMATVGYGDISPDTPALKTFTVFWIFVAVLFVFPQLSSVIVILTGRLETRAGRAGRAGWAGQAGRAGRRAA